MSKISNRILDLDAKVKGRSRERELVVVFSFQAEGQRTVQQIADWINDHQDVMRVKTAMEGVQSSVDDLQRKGIMSIILDGSGKIDNLEDKVIKYAITKLKFANRVEVAHYATLIPNIERNLPDDIKQMLEIELNEGKSKGAKYRNYHIANISVVVDNPIRGTVSKSKKGDNSDKGAMAVLYRRWDTGDVYIPDYWIRGWFGNNLRMVNHGAHGFNNVVADHCIVKNYKSAWTGDPVTCASGKSGSGGGITTNEIIPEGTNLELKVMFPTEGGYLKPDEFDKYMRTLQTFCFNGLGKHNREWGRVKPKAWTLTRCSDSKVVINVN